MKNKRFSAFLEKLNAFPLVRVMGLLTVMTVAFSASFAKYVSDADGSVDVGIVMPAATIDVKQQSLTVFDDGKYDPNRTAVERTAVIFKNSRMIGETKVVSETELSYNFIFYIPAVFAQSVAIQLVKEEPQEDGLADSSALTSLLVLKGLDGLRENGRYSTLEDVSAYAGVTGADTQYARSGNVYTSAAEGDANGPDHTVTIEKNVQMEAVYQYSFPTFDKTTDNPLVALIYSETVLADYWRVTIRCPQLFTLPAHTETEHRYVFQLFPIESLSENEGGENGSFFKDWNVDVADKINTDNLSVKDPQNWSLTIGADKQVTLVNTTANPAQPYADVRIGTTADPDSPENGISSGKYYPCRINGVFEQSSEIYGE